VDYMKHALSLAELALGYTSPNPAVGAVIVKDAMVAGVGFTQSPGSPHAEIMALRQAKDRARGASMYVALEPCCHFGRTPPCVTAIIDAGISEVHIALIDPNPLVAGEGVKQLQEAGITVLIGDHEEEARQLNESYIKFITTGMPFVITKFAMSLDGKIATKDGDSKWISGYESRHYVHRLRHTVDAIMVGANTVVVDDPQLSARRCSGKGGKTRVQPLRIIIDGKGKTPASARIFKEPGKTLIVTAQPVDEEKAKALQEAGAEIVELPAKEDIIDLKELFKLLGKRQITSILVEGGSRVFGSLFDNYLVDKVLVYVAPIIIGGEKARNAVGGDGVSKIADAMHLRNVHMECSGSDMLISGYVQKK
jgi:diaminohydroxyphosphoribosylaminopyrimidine deaminase/5-amino-6-(5-phosphoribosylamino)uracil reductase